MTPSGLVVWLRVATADGVTRITGRCLASSGEIARANLPCGAEEAVVSRASYAAGMPQPLKAGRCLSCGLRPIADGPKSRRCDPCEERHLSARRIAAEARGGGRAHRARTHFTRRTG